MSTPSLNQTPQTKADLPDPEFTSQTTNWKGTLTNCTRALGINSRTSFEDNVLSSTPLKDVQWASLFAYMHRRFGPPHVGCDDYKDLSAGWILTSKDPNLFVKVSPHLSGPGFSLLPYYQTEKAMINEYQEMEIPSDRIDGVKAAYRSTLIDLLRPVQVRDNSINAMGKVDHNTKLGQALLAYNENEDERLYGADRHPSCGAPMPLGMFGGNDWSAMCSMVNKLGNGDVQAGRAVMISLVREHLLQGMANDTPDPVKQIMLMFSDQTERDTLIKGFKLNDQEKVELESKLSQLRAFKGESSECVFLDQMTMDDAAAAKDNLLKLGLKTEHMMYSIKGLLLERTTAKSYEKLCKVGDKDFPETGIPEKEYLPANEIAAHMRQVFQESKRPDLEQWLDETLASPMGDKALERIVAHVQEASKKQSSSKKKAPK